MINAEIQIGTFVEDHGVFFIVKVGKTEMKMALNDEDIQNDLAEKIGEMIIEHVDAFLNSPEGKEQICALS